MGLRVADDSGNLAIRYASIDVLRTLALFVMVMVHFSENLSGYALPIAGFGAPLFALLSGLSYSLWLNGQRARGHTEEEISRISVRRGLFVFGVGFAFNVLVWLPEDAFNWDVLTLIGAALLLLNLVRRLPLSVVVLMAIMTLGVSPLLRGLAEYDTYWVNGYFDGDLTLPSVLVGFLATGYFPIFPWIAFSLVGFATGSHLFPVSYGTPASPEAQEPPPSPWPVALLGTGLLGLSLSALALRRRLPAALSDNLLGGWTMFPPTLVYTLGTLGIALLLFGLAHRWIDRNPWAQRHPGALRFAMTFSRSSFTIYVLHHVVHLWPLWIYGVATGHDPMYFWMRAMPVNVALPLAWLFLLVCYLWLRWLGTDKRHGIEAWMRWLCD